MLCQIPLVHISEDKGESMHAKGLNVCVMSWRGSNIMIRVQLLNAALNTNAAKTGRGKREAAAREKKWKMMRRKGGKREDTKREELTTQVRL